MQRTLYIKLAGVLVIGLLLLLPLLMIEGQIRERSARQIQVTADVAAASAGEQWVAGPVLVIPYRECQMVREQNDETKRWEEKCAYRDRRAVLIPEGVQTTGEVAVETRHRGIYRAAVFGMKAKTVGQFVVPANLGITAPPERIQRGAAYVAVGIRDVRGLRANPVLRVNGRDVRFVQGTREAMAAPGIHAVIGELTAGATQTIGFEYELDLAGTASLNIAPIGDTAQVSLSSNWPHPSFGGRFLPRSHRIDETGFQASWQVSSLATNANRLGDEAAKNPEAVDSFQIRFVEPVNIYLLAERAVKYGLLFVALTFASFFVFELLKRLPIHPFQYGLVGLALAMFFLLLISLSEHLSFALAYLVSATACIGLIGFYLATVLRSLRRGAMFGALLAVVYAALYGVLNSEDAALLMGSLLLFGALAAVMVLTRRVDWYTLGARGARAGGPNPAEGEAPA